MAFGSSKTRAAVSKPIRCYRRFARFSLRPTGSASPRKYTIVRTLYLRGALAGRLPIGPRLPPAPHKRLGFYLALLENLLVERALLLRQALIDRGELLAR